MPNRGAGGVSYRYGFNGQEAGHEIKGIGNSYTAEYWEYDPRLGRRWNIDPRPISGVSPYATFNNNPLAFTDHFGDTLDIGTNKESTADLMSLMKNKDNNKYISIAQYSGNVTLSESYTKLSKQEQREVRRKDKGFSLVYDLIQDKHKFYFAASNTRRYNQTNLKTGVTELIVIKLNEMFPAGTLLKGFHNETTRMSLLMERNTLYFAFNNLAHTRRGDEKDFQFTPSYKGFDGRTYDGEVWMARGKYYDENMLELPRASFVYHELMENFIRVNGNSYPVAHQQASETEAGPVRLEFIRSNKHFMLAPLSLYGNKYPGEAQNFKIDQ